MRPLNWPLSTKVLDVFWVASSLGLQSSGGESPETTLGSPMPILPKPPSSPPMRILITKLIRDLKKVRISRNVIAKCPGSSTDYPGFIIPENLVANDIPCMFRDSFEEEKMGFELDAETGPTIPDGMADSSADADWFFPPPLNAAECFEGSEDTTFSEESQGGDDF
eukprot:TRINITY_DN3082_c0_g1_i1.p1 TRINITY_DN3082_c0_g1~~TRINITY_DN3082_c0_g1_i1.p1  ORF type:complete len:166 (+),score=18.76 TRINITY_DN3082_c0_g1_i1:421-918(+)